MSTKDDNYSFIVQSFTPSELQYYNSVNLNQSEKCDTLIPVKSNCKPNNDKNCGTAATDFKVSDNYEEKEKFQWWNKSSKYSTFNEENDDLKKQWKNENTFNTTNKSTLSLHIAAYEDSTEARGVESDNKNEGQTLLTIQNSFEFPRQQENNKKVKPEVMQFKTTQKLLGSNKSVSATRGPKKAEDEHSTKRQLSTSHDKDESDLNQSGPDFGNVSKIPKFAQITPSNQTVYAIGSNRHERRLDEDNFDAITGANHEESCLEDLRLILTEDIEKCNSAQLISYRQKLSMSLQTAFNQSIHKNDLDNGIIAEASAKISQLDNSILMLRDLRRVASNKQLFENYSQGHKKLGSNSHGRRLDDIVYPPVPDHSLTNESTSGESHDLNTTAFGIKKQMDRIKIGANKIIVQKAKEDDKELADLKGEQ